MHGVTLNRALSKLRLPELTSLDKGVCGNKTKAMFEKWEFQWVQENVRQLLASWVLVGFP